ncbi:MAG: MBL fold metallo-hydrolase, partial [Clostridia bacterium]
MRGRAGMIIDDSLLVDFPPDMLMYVFNFDIDLAKIEDVIITHTHSDHFDPSQIMMRLPNCFCHIKNGNQTINIHGNAETGRLLKWFEKYEFGEEIDFVKFFKMTKFNTYKIGDFEVTPFPALHKLDEDAYTYLIKKDGKAMLYLNDTGLLYDEIYEYLEKENIIINFVSFDCTFGKDPDGGNHMGMPDNAKVKEKLLNIKVVNNDTIYYITHFSHNC